jgi:hypothetical protein
MAGFYSGTDLADKTFYGFKLNPDTGKLSLEVIDPNENSVVALPQTGIIDKYEYKVWVWTRDTLRFQWGNSHLQVKFV